MVEISPKLSEMQQQKLTGISENKSSAEASQNLWGSEEDTKATGHYKHCKSRHGPEVFWYKSPKEVPKGFTFFVAHEFFDALPIHKFQASLVERFSLLYFLTFALSCRM